MTAQIVSPNLASTFPDEDFPKQMWFVKIDKINRNSIKIKYLQKIATYMKNEDGKTKIYLEPKETIQNTIATVKVTLPQYTALNNDVDIKYYIGLTISGYFVFQIAFPEYNNDTIEKRVLTLSKPVI